MKTIFKNPLSLILVSLFVFTVVYAHKIDIVKKIADLTAKKGRYAKLDISSLPANEEITIKVKDTSKNLVDQLKVINTGQKYEWLNFDGLAPGKYHLNIIVDEENIVNKILNIHRKQVVLNLVSDICKETGKQTRWILFLGKVSLYNSS